MIKLEKKYPIDRSTSEEKAKGIYYVDDQCIDCDLCREIAPNNFTRGPAVHGYAYTYVYKQPENDLEKDECEKAMEDCPSRAIGYEK